MKRWEENRRKQLYNNRIQQAKPTLSNSFAHLLDTQPKKQRQPASTVSSSKGFTNTSVSTKVGAEDMFLDMGEVKISDLPIFQLLRAFKLQQYALVSAAAFTF